MAEKYHPHSKVEYSSYSCIPLNSSKKKILVFIDWFLPGYRAGGPIRSCANMIEHLREFYDFSIVTRDTDYHEKTSYKEIRSDEWNTLPDGTRVFYFSEKNLSRKKVKAILKNEKYDAVYVNGVFSFYFSLFPLWIVGGKGKNIIVAVRGMLGKGALSVKKIKKSFFLFASRAIGLFNNVTFQASGEQEAADIREHFGKNARVMMASNLPPRVLLQDVNKKIKVKGEAKIVSIARISPEKNTGFSLEVLRNVNGKAIFDMFGTVNNENYWSECKNILAKMPGNITAEYKGAIPPEKIISTLAEYDFMLMPSLSENFGHVILESFIAGTPVIISDQTMWKNISSANAGWDISLQSKEKFIKTIEDCIEMNNEEYQKWVIGAQAQAEKYLRNTELIEQNKRLFE